MREGDVAASTSAVERRGTTVAGPRTVTALVSIGHRLAAIAAGTNVDRAHESGTAATRSLVHVLVRATVRRHTRLSYTPLDGSRDHESEVEAASPGPTAPELLLRSELSFVMSSSVLLPAAGRS